MLPVKITRVIQTTAPDDQGRPVASVHVEFTLGSHGPFTVTMPKAQFTSAGANQKIQELARQVAGLEGLS